MTLPIRIQQNKILLAKAYLGSDQAFVWIGPHEIGPSDDDDDRVVRDRQLAEEAWQIGQTKRPSGINAFVITDTDGDGYYELDTTGWEPGCYRFMYHGKENAETPFGTDLDPEKRDLQYSWAKIPDQVRDQSELKPFVYWEPNGRGFCFRVEVMQTGEVFPAGS